VQKIGTCAQVLLSTDYRLFSTPGYGQFIYREKSLLFLKFLEKKSILEEGSRDYLFCNDDI